mgnify:CR=1 FL=1
MVGWNHLVSINLVQLTFCCSRTFLSFKKFFCVILLSINIYPPLYLFPTNSLRWRTKDRNISYKILFTTVYKLLIYKKNCFCRNTDAAFHLWYINSCSTHAQIYPKGSTPTGTIVWYIKYYFNKKRNNKNKHKI